MKAIFLLLLLLLHAVLGNEETNNNVINVILLGATGNLAQKYLWNSLFNIHLEGLTLKDEQIKGNTKIMIYPAATKSFDVANPTLEKILQGNITNNSGKDAFLNNRVAKYSQLRNPDQYEKLNDLITKTNKKNNEKEITRLIYLSVPPKFYGSICTNINKHLRPEKDSSLKIIVEKPFGEDLNSARRLADDMFKEVKPDEVLLVDHYMGKPVVTGIQKFRKLNPDYESLLKSNQVKDIEISMVETEDVAGRTDFYNDVGVIRDTMQNHLMMMLSLLMMDVFDKDSDEQNRLEVTQRISELTFSDVNIAAQYKDYNKHVNQDRKKWDQEPLKKKSNQLTFAKVELKVNGTNVPVYFTSGKALPKRRAFTRIQFKNDEELIFLVQGEFNDVSGASIRATKGLPSFNPISDSWKSVETDENDPKKSYHIKAPEDTPQAYQVLIRDALEGREENFVRLPEVLQSWRVFSPLLRQMERSSSILDSNLEYYQHGGIGLKDKLNSPKNDNNKKNKKDEL